MNFKYFLKATIAVFAFIFFYEWLIHGNLLMGLYEQTKSTWRDSNEMIQNMPLAMSFQLALALWLTFVFTQLFPESGVKKGLLFGLYFGVFTGILIASWYLWLPISLALAISWFFAGIGKGLGIGFLLGLIYHK